MSRLSASQGRSTVQGSSFQRPRASFVSCMPWTSTRSLTLTDRASAAGAGSLRRAGLAMLAPGCGGECRLGCWVRRASLPPRSPSGRRAGRHGRGQAVRQADLRAHRGRALLPGPTPAACPSFDGVPLDVNVTLPRRSARRALPARSSSCTAGPGARAGRPVEALGRGRLRGPQLHRARLRRVVRLRARSRDRPTRRLRDAAGSTSPTRATRRATPSTWPACWPTRAWSSPQQDRRHRRLLRRRPVA